MNFERCSFRLDDASECRRLENGRRERRRPESLDIGLRELTEVSMKARSVTAHPLTDLAKHVARFRVRDKLSPILVRPELVGVAQDPDRRAGSRECDVHTSECARPSAV